MLAGCGVEPMPPGPAVRSSPRGRFFLVARYIATTHIPYMAKPKTTPKRSTGPRAQHPRLVGFSEAENRIVERAAEKAEVRTNVYIREAALFQAREELGLVQPKGGE